MKISKKKTMDIKLSKEISYQTKEEFNSLLSLILAETKSLNLKRYIDRAIVGREIRPQTWNGEYLNENERKIYRLDGTNYTSTKGEENYYGNWKIVREEQQTDNGKLFFSDYLIRFKEPGIFSHINFEIQQEIQETTQIRFDWSKPKIQANNTHSRIIKSTVEYGVVSAFEDINPINARYTIKIRQVRYHPIDTSFKLLNFAAIRNTKRAFFTEQEDLNPILENGEFKHKGKLTGTIFHYNN
ncbi:MAG: hypothetical protein AB8G22_15185 [Saprospiraceae bacterium]